MNCLIIDDNPIARTLLTQLATHVKDVKVVETCANAFEAYNAIQQKAIDLLLLDIEMEGLSGLELTKNLGHKKPFIIFISSKKDYAIEAFELNVVDYIVKPVTPARFIQAIEKVRVLLQSKEQETQVRDDAFIFIRDSNMVKRLSLDEILYAEAMGDYVKLHTHKRFFAVHNTLREVELRLPPHQFIRVHRSYMVALNKIDTLEQGALIIQGKAIPVADAYRNTLNKRLNIL